MGVPHTTLRLVLVFTFYAFFMSGPLAGLIKMVRRRRRKQNRNDDEQDQNRSLTPLLFVHKKDFEDGEKGPRAE